MQGGAARPRAMEGSKGPLAEFEAGGALLTTLGARNGLSIGT